MAKQSVYNQAIMEFGNLRRTSVTSTLNFKQSLARKFEFEKSTHLWAVILKWMMVFGAGAIMEGNELQKWRFAIYGVRFC